jgi:hypothetical protein
LHHSVKIALIFKELMHSTEVKLFTFLHQNPPVSKSLVVFMGFGAAIQI